MSLQRRRRDCLAAEQALQDTLVACRHSTHGALQPLRRWWPALLLGSGAVGGWWLARGTPSDGPKVAPSVLLGQALGLLPLLLRWNAMLSAVTPTEAATPGVSADGAAQHAAASAGDPANPARTAAVPASDLP